MSLDKLLEKAKEYELSQEIIDSREGGRIDFVSKFPIDQIGKLQIDEYVAGTDKNSFSYWLEFKKILFGIGGGNASKFGLYKGADGNYYGGTGQNKILLKGKELEKQFEIIKTGIIKALDYVKNDRISEIKALNIPIWNMVLQKILTLYFPDKFITIGASDVLIECAKDISLDGIELIPENLIQINYECKKKLDSQAFLKDWSYEKIGSLIWETYHDDSKRDFYILGSKYGENNNVDVFPDMLANSVISVGFASKYDLTEYFQAKPREIVEFLEKKDEEQKSINALKHFLSLKVGDRIAIKASGSPKGTKGFLSIVGIAEVVEKEGEIYNHEPNGLGHMINVKYIHGPVYKEFEIGGYGSTIHKLTKPEQIELIFKGEFKSTSHSNNINNNQMDSPLNTILYGPPGTGKTFNTILRAAEIIENRKISSYQEALKIFKMNLHNRIEFITFHQNYSYEDFIQGLRPETDNKSNLTFEKRDGVFKRIADRALENLKSSNNNQSNYEEKFQNAINVIKSKIDEENEYFIQMKSSSFFLTSITTENIEGINKNFKKKFNFKIHNLFEDYKKALITEDHLKKCKLKTAEYGFTVEEIYKITSGNLNRDKNNFVIIIDEINRANISRVFGELITVIEPDKRSQGEIPLEAKLPSGDCFIVPSNLYIIGTMNTADKSIALLDIALRRRFEFESMYPLYEIKGSEIYDKDILLKINEQIIKSKGHDFQIGHAYFMGENKDLIQIMNKKVIPLLLEYFMNDEKEVKGILFNAGLQVEENSWPIKITGKRA